MGVKETLEGLMEGNAPGPSHAFQVFHAVKMLELLSTSPVGRGSLSKKLGIGEGSTRTLIERLRDHSIVSVSRTGCTLTGKGRQIWKALEKIIPAKTSLEKSKLTLSTRNVAILVKGKAQNVNLGLEQRDAALLAGAKGATTIIMKKGKLTMPDQDTDIGQTAPETRDRIAMCLKPQEGDVVIIGSADTPELAEYGAIVAAWTLLESKD